MSTNIYVKFKGGPHIECWIEAGFEVVAECKVIDAGDVLLIDEIFVKPKHRRKGYGKMIVDKLKTIKNVLPAGIVNTQEAKSFWNNLGMVDALGLEDKNRYESLLIENSTFEFRVEAS